MYYKFYVWVFNMVPWKTDPSIWGATMSKELKINKYKNKLNIWVYKFIGIFTLVMHCVAFGLQYCEQVGQELWLLLVHWTDLHSIVVIKNTFDVLFEMQYIYSCHLDKLRRAKNMKNSLLHVRPRALTIDNDT